MLCYICRIFDFVVAVSFISVCYYVAVLLDWWLCEVVVRVVYPINIDTKRNRMQNTRIKIHSTVYSHHRDLAG
jgi:hypothetical protein